MNVVEMRDSLSFSKSEKFETNPSAEVAVKQTGSVSEHNVYHAYVCLLHNLRPVSSATTTNSGRHSNVVEEESEPIQVERSKAVHELLSTQKEANTNTSQQHSAIFNQESEDLHVQVNDNPRMLRLTKMKWLTEGQEGPDSRSPPINMMHSATSICSQDSEDEVDEENHSDLNEKCLSTILRLDKEHNLFGLSSIAIIGSKQSRRERKEEKPAFPQTTIIQVCCRKGCGSCKGASKSDMPRSLKCGQCSCYPSGNPCGVPCVGSPPCDMPVLNPCKRCGSCCSNSCSPCNNPCGPPCSKPCRPPCAKPCGPPCPKPCPKPCPACPKPCGPPCRRPCSPPCRTCRPVRPCRRPKKPCGIPCMVPCAIPCGRCCGRPCGSCPKPCKRKVPRSCCVYRCKSEMPRKRKCCDPCGSLPSCCTYQKACCSCQLASGSVCKNSSNAMSIVLNRKPKFEPPVIELTPRSSCIMQIPLAGRTCTHSPRCCPPTAAFPYLMPCYWPSRPSAPCNDPSECFHNPLCVPPRERRPCSQLRTPCPPSLGNEPCEPCPNYDCLGKNKVFTDDLTKRLEQAKQKGPAKSKTPTPTTPASPA